MSGPGPSSPGAPGGALSHVRVCDLSGQLAGAGATKFLAAFGAEVIRVEDPVTRGCWDILRAGLGPHVDERRGPDMSGAFNNHNVEKLGITLNLRTERGRELLGELVERSDVLTENFAAGVLARLGFPYERLRELNPNIIYVSHTGFGHSGPYRSYRTWGPIVQAVGGLTFQAGLPNQPPAGWGYSYMDHLGACFLAIAVLAGLHHRARTGEGQWIDLAGCEAALDLAGPAILDYTVNRRPLRRPGMPNSNRSQSPPMAPHGIYPGAGEDRWVAIACRNDRDWSALRSVMGDRWVADARFDTLAGRLSAEDELDDRLAAWSVTMDPADTARRLVAVGVPSSVVARPEDRIEHDDLTRGWGLWPWTEHREIGPVRVEGIPVHLSESDWRIARAAPCLGQDNDRVFGELLGLRQSEIDELTKAGVL